MSWTKNFADNGLGQLVLTETKYGAGETTPVVTDYGYYPAVSYAATGSYSAQVRWSTLPNGTWTVNTYFVGSGPNDTSIADGQLATVLHPWLDGSPSAAAIAADPDAATPSNSAYDQYTYSYLQKGLFAGFNGSQREGCF